MIIREFERGLVFYKGNYTKFLKPGQYRKSLLRKEEVVVVNVREPFNPQKEHLTALLQDEELKAALHIVDVKDHELAIHLKDKRFENVLPPGNYHYWKQEGEQEEFIIMDTSDPDITKAFSASILRQLDDYAFAYQCNGMTKAFLYYNGVFQKELSPGRHYFWKNPVNVEIKEIYMGEECFRLKGQEILTKDKISLRINFTTSYQVIDPRGVLEKYMDHYAMLHMYIQLTLREYVGGITLDELLHDRKGPSEKLLEILEEKAKEYGVEFHHVGLVDVILPGEIKDILNTVLIAEKKAQANLLARREEIASTRSLLNTAKLMEGNNVLYKLKEMEYIERICDKIGHIQLNGQENVLTQMQQLFGKRGA